MAYSTTLKEKGQERGITFPGHRHFEQQIAKELPLGIEALAVRVDMALS